MCSLIFYLDLSSDLFSKNIRHLHLVDMDRGRCQMRDYRNVSIQHVDVQLVSAPCHPVAVAVIKHHYRNCEITSAV